MITFFIGLLILFFGCITYSRFIEKQYSRQERAMPYGKLYNGVDYVPLDCILTDGVHNYFGKTFSNIFTIAVVVISILWITVFMFNAEIGFNFSLKLSEVPALILMFISLYAIIKKCKESKEE